MTSGSDDQVKRRGPGRPRIIPPEHFDTILQLYKGGLGYRSIANHLRGLGVGTTHSAARRMIKGEGGIPQVAVVVLLVATVGYIPGSRRIGW